MSVRFCEMCDNMLYVRVNEKNELSFTCQYCNHSVQNGNSKGNTVFVSKTVYNNNSSKYQQFVTPLLHEDPSLPRVDYIACPNPDCTKGKNEENKVLYVKYDSKNLKYLYSCAHCKHFWT